MSVAYGRFRPGSGTRATPSVAGPASRFRNITERQRSFIATVPDAAETLNLQGAFQSESRRLTQVPLAVSLADGFGLGTRLAQTWSLAQRRLALLGHR